MGLLPIVPRSALLRRRPEPLNPGRVDGSLEPESTSGQRFETIYPYIGEWTLLDHEGQAQRVGLHCATGMV